jgi:homoserine O-acetyltransferase/O-succinyltransferase
MRNTTLVIAVLFAFGCAAAAPPAAPPAPECPSVAPEPALALSAPAPIVTASQPGADAVPAPLLPAKPDPQPPLFGKLGDLPLASGETIKDCQIEYRTLGPLNADKSNVVVWATWFSGITKDLVELARPGKLVDSTKYHVVLVGALSNGVSSSPSNSPQQPRVRFPVVGIRDMVESQHRLLTRVLGLTHVRAVMGISMGGMQTFQWGVSYPDFMDKLIPIVGSPRLAPYDLLLWQTNLDAVQRDPAYSGGNYREQPVLPIVQQLADLNLTTFDDYNKAKTREQVGVDHAGLTPPQFDANDRVRQLQAMMAHDIGKTAGGSLENAAKALKAKLLVVVNERDAMVTPTPALEFAKLARAETLVLKGECGHKAPTCEEKTIATRITQFLK